MPTEPTKKFVLEAEFGDLVAGIQQVNLAMDRMDKKFTAAVHGVKKVDSGFSGMIRSIRQVSTVIAAAYGVSQVFSAFGEAIGTSNARIKEFSDEMAGLLFLDKNVDQMDRLTKKVTDLSESFGLTTGEVAKTMFSVQSQASLLSQGIQEDIARSATYLGKAAGINPSDWTSALIGPMITYGDEIRDVTQAQNLMLTSANRGKAELGDFADLLSRAVVTGKAAGLSFNEVLSAFTIMSQTGPKVRITLREMSGIFSELLDPMKSGVTMANGFSAAMEQIAKRGKDVNLAVFGRENIRGLLALVDGMKSYNAELAFMNETAKRTDDIAKDIYEKKLRDPLEQTADIVRRGDATRKKQDTEFATRRQEMINVQVRQNLPPYMRDGMIQSFAQGASGAWSSIMGGSRNVIGTELEWGKADRAVGNFAGMQARRETALNPWERAEVEAAERKQLSDDVKTLKDLGIRWFEMAKTGFENAKQTYKDQQTGNVGLNQDQQEMKYFGRWLRNQIKSAIGYGNQESLEGSGYE